MSRPNKKKGQAQPPSSAGRPPPNFVSQQDLLNLLTYGICPSYQTPPSSGGGYINLSDFSLTEEEFKRQMGGGGGKGGGG